MKRFRMLLCWLLCIFVLVIATYFAVPLMVRLCNNGNIFTVDTMMSLYISIYTLEATLLIAVLIYSLQESSTKWKIAQQKRSAKRIILTELEAGLKAIILYPHSGCAGAINGHLFDLVLAYLPDVQEMMSPELLHHLIQIVDLLSGRAKLALQDSEDAAEYVQANLPMIIQPQFYSAMTSPFAARFADVSDYRCVLNDETRALLGTLSDQELPDAAGDCLYTKRGQKLLECAGDGRVKIYDAEGGLLCDAILDSDSTDLRGIDSGWAKVRDYEGEFRNGVRDGRGCSYSLVYHHKLFEGIWKCDNPFDGTQFDVVVERCRNAGEQYRYLFPYWREYSMVESHLIDYLSEDDRAVDFDRLYVCDIQGKVEGEEAKEINVRPLYAFVEQEDAERLEALQKLRRDLLE